MKILGLIPARVGSKGIPRKNIKLLGGKPLINYSIELALNCKILDKVVVSTDDEEIAKISRIAGADIPFIRPKSLAEDTTPTLPVIQHALHFFNKKGAYYDVVCLLQPTVPFRSLKFLTKAINIFIEKKADTLISVKKIPHQYNPHWAFESDSENWLRISTGDKEIISRRQDLPNSYYRDGSIYLIKSNIILEENTMYGDKITFCESSGEADINIDTVEDWKKAEGYITGLINK